MSMMEMIKHYFQTSLMNDFWGKHTTRLVQTNKTMQRLSNHVKNLRLSISLCLVNIPLIFRLMSQPRFDLYEISIF